MTFSTIEFELRCCMQWNENILLVVPIYLLMLQSFDHYREMTCLICTDTLHDENIKGSKR